MSDFWTNFEKTIRSDWALFLLAVVAILGITAIVSTLVTKFLRKLLHYNKENNLPSSSIFINIARAAIWIIGVCIMLSTCFNVDVSAMIAALGVGGIAVSLGFQNTLSNLIAGLQISLMHIVKPGDTINVGTDTGVVKDVNWWNTTIIDNDGNTILIPNSKLVTSALTHLLPVNEAVIPLVVTVDGKDIEAISEAIEREALRAATLVGPVLEAPDLEYTNIIDDGFSANLGFAMVHESDVDAAKDAIIRAIAPLVHATDAQGALSQEQQKEAATDKSLPPKAKEDTPAAVNARLNQESKTEPLVEKGSAPADVVAATMSTLEGAILGKAPARKRIAHAFEWIKGKSSHGKARAWAVKKKHGKSHGKKPVFEVEANNTSQQEDSKGSKPKDNAGQQKATNEADE